MRFIIKYLLKNQRLKAYLRNIYQESKLESVAQTTVGEVSPIECRESEFEEKRINILLPALSEKYVFGGISTALAFFEALGSKYENLRIILTDEQHFTAADNRRFADWRIVSLDDGDSSGKCIVAAGDRYNRSLSVGKNDIFVATAWWTAFCAKQIQAWQHEHYGLGKIQKFVYLIQDYEPGFYAWSSKYALAESTYRESEKYIAVLNSKELKDFFDKEGYVFYNKHYFEPTLHPKLKDRLVRCKTVAKENRCLVYGRPGVERNAFELIVMGLREWVKNNPKNGFSFVSAGEKHQDIDLGYGYKLCSVGKLSIDEYAEELARASVGVSLMISPHPSYPPLEMAAFGVRVITNGYGVKNLSKLTTLITSVDTISPAEIAKALTICVSAKNEDNISLSGEWKDYIEKDEDFTKLANSVFEEL